MRVMIFRTSVWFARQRIRRTQCWRATNIDQERALNFDQAFYCVANYATVDKFTRL